MKLFARAAELQVDTIVVKDLRFSFRVERGIRPVPGKAEIKVYNLNADHRAQLEGLTSSGSRRIGTRLRAGYGTDLAVIFAGDLRVVSNVREGQDWITTISGEDGGGARRSARTNRSFRPGTDLLSVLRGVISDSGVGEGNLASVAGAAMGALGSVFGSGTTTSGNAVEEVERLADSAGHEVSIQNNAFQFLPRGRALAGSAIVVSESTGMVGSPEKLTRGRIRVKTLIIPDLVPGRLITIDSLVLRGTFRVEKASWTADTRGADWYVEVEASPYASATG